MANQRRRTGQNDTVFKAATAGRGSRAGAARTRSKAKPAAKPAATKPALSSEGVRGFGGKGPSAKTAPTGSSAYNAARNKQIAAERERLKGVGNPPASKPSPAPSPKPAKAPAPAAGSTTTRPAEKVPASALKVASRNVGPVASGDDYARNKDPKKYNPLMQKTFGYQKGDAPDQRAKRDNYSGTDSGVNPSTKVEGSKFKGGSATNRTSAAYSQQTNLLDKKISSIAQAASKRLEDQKKKKK